MSWIGNDCQATRQISLPEISPETQVPESPEIDLREKLAALRAINCLRSGIPPSDKIEELTIANQELLKTIQRIYFEESEPERWTFICGEYGAGKTHSLALFSSFSLSNGYAHCSFSADAWGKALNHPERFVASLLESLELPGVDSQGFASLLHGLLIERNGKDILIDLIHQHLQWGISTKRELFQLLIDLKSTEEEDRGNDGAEIVSQIISILSGQKLVNRQGSIHYRRQAYQLLRLAREIIRSRGLKGISIAVDEVESVFTKLPSERSREGALRSISALIDLQDPLFLAITPDNLIALQTLSRSGISMEYCAEEERNHHWLTRFRKDSQVIYRCKPLTPRERIKMLGLVLGVYSEAYEQDGRRVENTEIWKNHLARVEINNQPIRILLRETVGLLDAFRYSHITPSPGV